MSAPDPVATSLPGGMVLLGPVGVGYCERALRLVERAAARDGIAGRPQVRELAQVLAAALGTAASGRAAVPDEPVPPVSERVSAVDAAKHLGIKARGMRDLCARGALPAVRIGGRWVIDRADLVAYADQRARGGTMSGNSSQPGTKVVATVPHGAASAFTQAAAESRPQPNLALLRQALGLDARATDEQVRAAFATAGYGPVEPRHDECRTVLDAAVKAGKFPPARREHYERLWAADPDGTKSLVASLAAVPPSPAGMDTYAALVYDDMYRGYDPSPRRSPWSAPVEQAATDGPDAIYGALYPGQQ